MSEKLRRVAVHEAGHAIMARALGEMVNYCRIWETPDGSVGGSTDSFEKRPLYLENGKVTVPGSKSNGAKKVTVPGSYIR